MPNVQPPSQTPGKEGDPGYGKEAFYLIFILDYLSEKVQDIENHLLGSYPEQGLKNLSLQFERIRKGFTDISLIREEWLYEYINRSQDRLRFAKAVANEARNLAILFEKYSRNPRAYSAVNSRIQINHLQVQLKTSEALYVYRKFVLEYERRSRSHPWPGK